MSDILNYMEENYKETQRLIGGKYEQLQQLLQNAGRLMALLSLWCKMYLIIHLSL